MSFLHQSCKQRMCTDCVEIAEEYEELLSGRTSALQTANAEVETLLRELRDVKRRSDVYESVSKAGINQIIAAWMDKEIGALLKPKDGTK